MAEKRQIKWVGGAHLMRQRRERVHGRLTQETRETPVRSQGGEHALGEDVAARSSALAGESHRGAWQATSHRVAESHNRATKRTHSGRMVGVTGGSMLRRSQMVDRALGAALPPALRATLTEMSSIAPVKSKPQVLGS